MLQRYVVELGTGADLHGANMTKAATLTHYPNQTTLICRADGSCWFGLSKYFVNHLRARK